MQLDQKDYQYLYPEENMLVFMDTENYEQIHMNKELVGDALPFLQENMIVATLAFAEPKQDGAHVIIHRHFTRAI